MSPWAQAVVAARKAVSSPTMATTLSADEEWVSSGLTLAIRYTPAVTMVAAWMSADTGVGPSMASGSQMNNGIWADFPTAPRNSRRAMAGRAGGPMLPTG